MKRMLTFYIVGLICLAIILIIFSCQKTQRQTPVNDISAKPSVFNKSVGAPLDSATAKRWKLRLAEKMSRQKTVATTSVYYIPASALKDLIMQPAAVGICFYFGEDSLGNRSLIPIGVDNKGYIMHTATVQTTRGIKDWSVTRNWRNRFKEVHIDEIWGYFWGSNAVERLLAQGTELVRIELGINDKGTQQIMFSNAAETDPAGYEDMTSTCPPFCPIDTEVG